MRPPSPLLPRTRSYPSSTGLQMLPSLISQKLRMHHITYSSGVSMILKLVTGRWRRRTLIQPRLPLVGMPSLTPVILPTKVMTSGARPSGGRPLPLGETMFSPRRTGKARVLSSRITVPTLANPKCLITNIILKRPRRPECTRGGSEVYQRDGRSTVLHHQPRSRPLLSLRIR
jgi:hypothetical protein